MNKKTNYIYRESGWQVLPILADIDAVLADLDKGITSEDDQFINQPVKLTPDRENLTKWHLEYLRAINSGDLRAASRINKEIDAYCRQVYPWWDDEYHRITSISRGITGMFRKRKGKYRLFAIKGNDPSAKWLITDQSIWKEIRKARPEWERHNLREGVMQ